MNAVKETVNRRAVPQAARRFLHSFKPLAMLFF